LGREGSMPTLRSPTDKNTQFTTLYRLIAMASVKSCESRTAPSGVGQNTDRIRPFSVTTDVDAVFISVKRASTSSKLY
jgi:hypothetical protein